MDNDFEEVSLPALLEARSLYIDEIDNLQRNVWLYDSEIKRRMAETSSREYQINGYKITHQPVIHWNKPRLKPLLELEYIPPKELHAAWTPEHEITVVVPENWNMTKTKALSKYGKEVQDILTQAMELSEGPLVVKKL